MWIVTGTFTCLSVAENIWHDVKCRGSFPPALCGHAACVVENRMYIHGGFADEVSLDIMTCIQSSKASGYYYGIWDMGYGNLI